MRYRLLGRSGLRVSELCLGTMTFGNKAGWGADKEESRQIFDAFVQAGGNFVDTANVYASGTSEEYVGEFLAGKRERTVLATKYTMSSPVGDPNSGGNQRKNMVQALEASLRRLGTDYIDLYWVHAWDFITPVEEIMRALDDLVRVGKVLYTGVSNAPAWTVARANTLAELRGWTPFVALQIEYSLAERSADRELVPMARALDIAITSWSPLAAGVLTGKYNPDAAATQQAGGTETRRLDPSQTRRLNERNFAIAAVVRDVAGACGRPPVEVALAWVRQQGAIPILGVRTAGQLAEALASVDLVLEEEHLRRLDEASRLEPGYPHDFLGREDIRRSVFGGFHDQIDL
jgi:aryl-alcohol dehydrogenase-like predicted oxidoreductase